MEGELFLKNGALKGLSALSRSMDTKLEVVDGAGDALGVEEADDFRIGKGRRTVEDAIVSSAT